MTYYTVANFMTRPSVGRLIRRIDKLGTALLDERLGAAALNLPQWIALKLVADGTAATAGDIAREVGHTTGATTRLIDGLEERGLLVRDRSGEDRRVVRLGVTAAGRAAVAAIIPVVIDTWNGALSDFTPAETDAFLAALEKLSRALEDALGTPIAEAAE